MPEKHLSRPVKRGELARRCGCHVETVRYYEQIGLLNTPDRTEGGHRLYSNEDQTRLRFILRSRELGFTIEELRGMLSLVDSHHYTCGDVYALTQKHLEDIRQKIADLRRLEETLSDMASQCQGGNVPDCPIINILYEG